MVDDAHGQIIRDRCIHRDWGPRRYAAASRVRGSLVRIRIFYN